MKKRHYISLLILLAGLTVSAGFFLFPRQLPPERCSVVYREYKDAKDIRATFIHDFQVNDTLCLDVTLLEATTDAGWDTLQAHFRLPVLPEHIQKKIDNGKDMIGIRLSPKKDPTLPTDTAELINNDVLAISYQKQSICVFHIHTLMEMDAARESKYDKPD